MVNQLHIFIRVSFFAGLVLFSKNFAESPKTFFSGYIDYTYITRQKGGYPLNPLCIQEQDQGHTKGSDRRDVGDDVRHPRGRVPRLAAGARFAASAGAEAARVSDQAEAEAG